MTYRKAHDILYITVKKGIITSKCGKKVEVFYFSDHPANKITGTAGLDDLKIEDVKLPNKNKVLSFSLDLASLPLPPIPSPLAVYPPETMTIDDSLDTDKVEPNNLVEGDLYKIKGLNIIARYEDGNIHRRFNFHNNLFWVEESSILKATDFEKANYNKHTGGY